MRSAAHPLATFVAAAFALAAAAAPADATWPAGWARFELPPPAGTHAWVYVPPQLAGVAGAPAVVFLHGAGATPQGWIPFLQPAADALGLVLLVPKSGHDFGWGIGPDDAIVEATLRLATDSGTVDRRRVGLAGHSAGGAYAIELAYSTPTPFSGVFALASPYRTVVRLPAGVPAPPLRLYYGTADPNYSGAYPALAPMLTRLGVDWSLDARPGLGHSDVPPEALAEGFAFLRDRPVPGCVAEARALCLGGGRFHVQAEWETAAASGMAGAIPLTGESGGLWFFAPGNVEVDVKVLDGCGYNGRWWVFAAGLTNVGVTLAVTDTATGQRREYRNARGKAFLPIQDTAAFACP